MIKKANLIRNIGIHHEITAHTQSEKLTKNNPTMTATNKHKTIPVC